MEGLPELPFGQKAALVDLRFEVNFYAPIRLFRRQYAYRGTEVTVCVDVAVVVTVEITVGVVKEVETLVGVEVVCWVMVGVTVVVVNAVGVTKTVLVTAGRAELVIAVEVGVTVVCGWDSIQEQKDERAAPAAWTILVH